MMHTPPPDLPPEAAAKWAEIVGDQDADTLTPLDLDIIASYARAFAEEEHALRLLALCPNPFIVAGDGQPYVNPLRAIVNKARDEMNRLRREMRKQPPTSAATLTEHKRRLLVEIQRRHIALTDETPTAAGQTPWETGIMHGPIFSAARWFDCEGDDAGRMRWQRAMSELIDDGLVVTKREDGAKWFHVMLTPEGEQIVEALATQGK